jgi:hypothetical protein
MSPRLRPSTLSASIALTLLACAGGPVTNPTPAATVPAEPAEPEARVIARTLDDFHDAAAKADEPRYFAHFARGGIFLGTDATERWDVAAFRAFAHPHFARGHGWTYRATRRSVTLSRDGAVAWFDEDLLGEKIGPCRGSGVLVREDGSWKLAQYNLALTVPNERFAAVRAAIDATPAP